MNLSKLTALALSATLLAGAACGDDADDANPTTESSGPDTSVDPADLDPIQLAYVIVDAEGVGSLTGNAATEFEDTEAARTDREFQALVAWANEHGGIGGRQIEAQSVLIPVDELTDEAKLAQRCVQVTEDLGVEFIVDTVALTYASTAACVAQHGVAMATTLPSVTEQQLAEMSPYIATNWPSIDQQFTVMPALLDEVGYLSPDEPVAVFLDDRPEVRRAYTDVLEPALAERGIEPVAVERAAAADAAAIANIALGFRSAGATRVIFVGNIVHFVTFSSTAESQGYRPRYAFPDYDAAASSAAVYGQPEQLAGAVGVSACDYLVCIVDEATRSSEDVTTPYDRDTLPPGFTKCLEVMSEARGVDYFEPATAGSSAGVAIVCDTFLLWLEAARAVGPTVTAETWAQGLRSLGSDVTSPRIHAVDYRDGRLAGASEFSAGTFDETCVCYVREVDWR